VIGMSAIGPFTDADGRWCCKTVNGEFMCGRPCPYGLKVKPRRLTSEPEPDKLRVREERKPKTKPKLMPGPPYAEAGRSRSSHALSRSTPRLPD